MRDINFFSKYKTAKARSKDIILISVFVILVVAGAVFAGFYFMNQQFDAIRKETLQASNFLGSQDTIDKLNELDKVKQQVGLLEQYQAELLLLSNKLGTDKIIGTDLLSSIESRMPAGTRLMSFSVSGAALSLNCFSTVATDPEDFLHALKQDPRFSDVSIQSVLYDTLGQLSFAYVCQLKGGAGQ